MDIPGYDAWKLSAPEQGDALGVHEGEECNRLDEPDEDAPRNWRARPCKGTMIVRQEGAEYHETAWVECDTCGATA